MIIPPEMAEVLVSFGTANRATAPVSRLPMPPGVPVSPPPVLRDVVARRGRGIELVISTNSIPGMPDGVTVAHEDGTFGHLGPGHHDLLPGTAVLSLLGDVETAVAVHGGHGYRLLLSAAGRHCAAMAGAARRAGLSAERCRPISFGELSTLVPADGAGRAILCGLSLRWAAA
ncbi:hypothetical protein [Amycolatopsis keratiniphila]|uniref:hypothetical protein n=1 Tax=Amycolatopsis keratiniphila TaxID=129921 RepID=UPI00087DCA23|nr:hypothetical protein [Amycolatopsis keratiniphila]OLZ47277.1 hypothetical protein BS330_35020 [Amycolatopsis keratiniphila subsp. nogabecina]SDU38415.1 hypothetical protein SAMN04489733_3615 [Amycolatopsis keratiniphila]